MRLLVRRAAPYRSLSLSASYWFQQDFRFASSTSSKGFRAAQEREDSGTNGKADGNHQRVSPNVRADDLPLTFADISRAAVSIRGGVKRTTCEHSHYISELVGANVYFKNEFRQFTGSFKERGARNAILQLMRKKQGDLKGVVAASAGNHALALAYHGKELGVPVTVVMPTVAPLAKVDKCRVSANSFCTSPLSSHVVE